MDELEAGEGLGEAEDAGVGVVAEGFQGDAAGAVLEAAVAGADVGLSLGGDQAGDGTVASGAGARGTVELGHVWKQPPAALVSAPKMSESTPGSGGESAEEALRPWLSESPMKEMERRVARRLAASPGAARLSYWSAISMLVLGVVILIGATALDFWAFALSGGLLIMVGLILYNQVEMYVIARRLADPPVA